MRLALLLAPLLLAAYLAPVGVAFLLAGENDPPRSIRLAIGECDRMTREIATP